MKKLRQPGSVILASTLILSAPLVAWAQASQPRPGFNLFSTEQDIEIGRQSTAEAERQLSLLNDQSVDRYLNQIVQGLASVAPGARYPYQIKTVNAPEINAFALPGGPMYVNRGLLLAVRGEAELAGVLAHEMSHVALRHGTHQASKAYLGQAGLGILGGLLGRNGGNTSQIVNAIGGVGLNVAFLKFSRDDEYEADEMGASIMAHAGYDPLAMASFFETLRREQGRDPGSVEQFLSDHPSSADRETRIREEARSLGPVRSQEVGGFDRMRAALGDVSFPDNRRRAVRREPRPNDGRRNPRQFDVRFQPPSSRSTIFEQRNRFYTIEHPDNWRAYAADPGFAVSIAPDGGVVDIGNGQQAMLYGVIVNHYAPFEGQTDRQRGGQERSYAPFEDAGRRRGSLEDATDDLVRQVIRSNGYLRAEAGPPREEQIDGAAALSVVLSGISPVTREEERVTVFTRSLPDNHVIYALCIVPGRYYDSVARTFARMIRTLSVDEEATHRGERTGLVDPRSPSPPRP